MEAVKNRKKTIYDEYQVGEVLGGFVGFLQHSKPAKGLDGKSGMMANIFGENGEDSDTITALNLTKFQNISVKITIWSIKDKNGKLLKYVEDNEEKFPKIVQFIGKIHRPTSSVSGLTAKFFGEDGGNADAINELNKTEYNNSLVFVQVQLAEENALLSEIETEEPDLSKEVFKLTPKELKALEKQQQVYEQADNVLRMNGFYRNFKVVSKLGTIEEYKKFLLDKKCIVDGCSSKPTFFENPLNKTNYNFVPVCEHHIKEIEEGVSTITDVNSFFNQMNNYYLNEFSKYKLREMQGITEDFHLDPKAVYNWAVANNLTNLIPAHYHNFARGKS